MNKMKWREVAVDPMFNLECFLDSQDKTIEEKGKEIKYLQSLIDKATNYYLKTLDKNGSMSDEAVEMFNLLEGNK
jgi:hypothetical protein